MSEYKDTAFIAPVYAGAQIQGPAGMPEMTAVVQGAPAPAPAAPAAAPAYPAAMQGMPQQPAAPAQVPAAAGMAMHATMPRMTPAAPSAAPAPAAMPQVPGQSQRLPHAIPAAGPGAAVSGFESEATGPVIDMADSIEAVDTALSSIEHSAGPRRPGYTGLVSSTDEAWDLANELKNSRFIPPVLRGRVDDIFMVIARSGVAGIPWAAAFDSLHTIPNRNGDLTMSMSVKAKMGVCARYGHFQSRMIFENGKPVGHAWGVRHGTPVQYEARYSFDDASLARRMAFKDGQYVGLNNVWEHYWPEMLKKRAMGRLLDIMFPDIILGLPSEDELDLLLDSQDTAYTAPENSAVTRLQNSVAKVRRKGRTKATVIDPADSAQSDVPAAAAASSDDGTAAPSNEPAPALAADSQPDPENDGLFIDPAMLTV